MPIDSPSSTSTSLLGRVKANDAVAWQRLTQLYGPIVYRWSRQMGLSNEDAADVVQDVFQSLLHGIERFNIGGPGRFQTWLYTVTRNKVIDLFRRQRAQPNGVGGTSVNLRLADVADLSEDSRDDSDILDELAQRALQIIRTDFTEQTWQAFWQVTVQERDVSDVAQRLNMSKAAVYKAKSRVLLHLRRELDGLN